MVLRSKLTFLKFRWKNKNDFFKLTIQPVSIAKQNSARWLENWKLRFKFTVITLSEKQLYSNCSPSLQNAAKMPRSAFASLFLEMPLSGDRVCPLRSIKTREQCRNYLFTVFQLSYWILFYNGWPRLNCKFKEKVLVFSAKVNFSHL